MDTCKTNSWKYLQEAIDAEIKSLEESILTLKQRRNALAPISSLPIEVISTIFSILRVPVAQSPLTLTALSENPGNLPWFRISHVCHHWREIALDQPLFWSHLRLTNFSSAGVGEMLARAKMVPIYLEAMVPNHWNGAQFSAFQKEIRMHASHISHLDISADFSRFSNVVKGLVSPAPILEYLSLVCTGFPNSVLPSEVCIPDTLFDGTTPRLSCLKLRKCDISWRSPLLKGLKCLEMHYPFWRPSLSNWLDALDAMSQLQILILHEASPEALPLPGYNIERTIALPFLSVLVFSAFARDYGFALDHLVLPALTRLCLTVRSDLRDGSDVQEILPCISQHARGFQNTQRMVVRNDGIHTNILAWFDVSSPEEITFLDEMPSAPLEFSYTSHYWSSKTHEEVFDAAMAALPLENLVSLTSQTRRTYFSKEVWLHHAQRWSLLQRVCLSPSAVRGFTEMLMEDNEGRGNPLLPSFTTLVLVDELDARRTLRLCDALMNRVEQGVPLEELDLQACLATGHAVHLLSEIVVDVHGPVSTLQQSLLHVKMKLVVS